MSHLAGMLNCEFRHCAPLMPTRPRKNNATRCAICGCSVQRHGCSRKSCKYPHRFPTKKEVKRRVAAAIAEPKADLASSHPVGPPPKTQTIEFWRQRETKKRLRLQSLEWLRLESLRLGQSQLTSEQKKEHTGDLEKIATGEYHVLLGAEPVHWVYQGLNRKGDPIIGTTSVSVLKPVRVHVIDPKTGWIQECTMFKIDQSKPTVAPQTQIALLADYNHSKVIKDCNQEIRRARANTPESNDRHRQKGKHSGVKASLSRMREALHLWGPARLGNSDKTKPISLAQLGRKAKCFGPSAKPFAGNAEYYRSRGNDVKQLALSMMMTARQEPEKWWSTFS